MTESIKQPTASDLSESAGSVCLECKEPLEAGYKVRCFIKFKSWPTLCAKCFLERLERWALSDDETEDAQNMKVCDGCSEERTKDVHTTA